MCHKPAQIYNICTPSTDTIYITAYNKSAFFRITLKIFFNCKHKFRDVFEKVFICRSWRDFIFKN